MIRRFALDTQAGSDAAGLSALAAVTCGRGEPTNIGVTEARTLARVRASAYLCHFLVAVRVLQLRAW
jgi:hypothetical protein